MESGHEHHLLPSQHLGHPVHLWRYGWWGRPVLVFPTASGMAHEWEAHGMVDALGDLLAAGRIKLYCTESNVAEAWTRRECPPEWRIHRHQAFERYVVEELVPFIRQDCHSGPELPVATAGCSLGAFYAANSALKYPQTFTRALCMSGRYEMTHFTGGFVNDDVYFNNPLAYVPGLAGEALERVRGTTLTLVCGQGMWEEGCIEETQALADLLMAKGVPCRKDIWGYDVAHEWEWWQRQAHYHLEQSFG